jgi:hypothetical protein
VFKTQPLKQPGDYVMADRHATGHQLSAGTQRPHYDPIRMLQLDNADDLAAAPNDISRQLASSVEYRA